ncbi:hypothetical protein FIU28_17370 [Tardiphaga sp. vice154]|uniref:hypothetical protein n=1 Tax=Tardiphaga sp. vice154 TaxID=2592814 RepID=UPI0011641A61|nr:hypothetical protein [Tardiphaga sp. vice154]QDM22722.1 hypothetical protein FIU28_17370 [Tardiphaga sp. vice154]
MLAVGLLVAGCAKEVVSHMPPVATHGARFLASELTCQPKVVPPDRAHRQAKDGVKYDERLDQRGDDCAGKLSDVGGQLEARGLVAR